MGDIQNILGSGWESQEHKYSYEEQFLRALDKLELHPEEEIQIDGEIHRFGQNKSGWYIIFPGEIPCGRFGDWRQDIDQTWCGVPEKQLDLMEMAILERKIEEAREQRRVYREELAVMAATKAKAEFEAAGAAPSDHPYLTLKKVKAHGLKETCGYLVAPIYDRKGEIVSLQTINQDGRKSFLVDSSISGGFWWLKGDSSRIYIAEGFSTAASVYEATGKTTFITYSASNIHHVARMLREQCGAMQDIVIVVDNDTYGVGAKYASVAVESSACKTISTPSEKDANDYAQKFGLEALKGVLEPTDLPIKAQDNWLIPASSFCTDFQPIKWLIKKVLPRESLIMIYGPSGAGKTFCVLDMCLSIATGRGSWFGLKVNEGSVVYLAGEGQMGLRKRVAAWSQVYKPKKMNMFVSKNGCDLNTAGGLQKVADSLKQNNITPDLIVVDTLHRFLLGDENSAQDTKTMLDSCSALTNHYKCSVILVHHVGASELAQHRPRGSTSWWGALDSGICLYAAKEDGTPIQLVQAKAKDDEPVPALSAGISSVPITGWFDEDGDQVTSAIFIAKAHATKKGNESLELFKAAWEGTGKEEADGYPYISRSGFMVYLERTRGLTYKQADTELKKIISALKLEPEESGWADKKGRIALPSPT